MKVLGIMKSQESYNRIQFQISNTKIEWEEYIRNIEDIQERISFIQYDLAIIDEKVWWKEEAIELLTKFDIKIIFFEGDFEKISNNIDALVPTNKKEIEILERDEEVPEDDRPIRYVETERIIERQVRVKVPVYTEIYTNIPKKLVVVANLSKRAGSTFVTLNLAKMLSEYKVLSSVIEPPFEPYIFDNIGLEQRLNKTDEEESLQFYSYPHEIYEGKKLERERETVDDGIIWMVADPRRQLIKEDKWSYQHMMKLLYSSRKASISLLDVGGHLDHESIEPLLDEADILLLIVDPMPSEMMMNNNLLERFLEAKKKGFPVEFVVNRWTSGIERNEFTSALKTNPVAYIPAIDLKDIHKAVYECEIPFRYAEVKEQLEKSLFNITKQLVPNDIWDKEREEEEKDSSFINKIKGKFLKRREEID